MLLLSAPSAPSTCTATIPADFNTIDPCVCEIQANSRPYACKRFHLLALCSLRHMFHIVCCRVCYLFICAALIPAEFSTIGPRVCVEIKPKAGCMPAAGSPVAADSIKRRLPRFMMHQLLKHLKVSSASRSQ
jgi:hypothetical protein